MNQRARLALVAVLLAAGPPGAARAETLSCTVMEALPIVIDTPGNYCLAQDFASDYVGSFVQILADDVVFDCNGHTLRNTNPASGSGGVSAVNDRTHVTIRNCTLDDFYTGIYLQGSSDPGALGNTVQNNLVRGSTSQGISVWGTANVIEGNRVIGNTGSWNGVAYGIFLVSMNSTGTGNVIRDNIVADFRITPPGTAAAVEGISFHNVSNTEVSGNHVSGLYSITNQGVAGIISQGTIGSVVAGNTVLSVPQPLSPPLDGPQGSGIVLFGPIENHSLNVCRDNIVGHWNSNISGCVKTNNTEF